MIFTSAEAARRSDKKINQEQTKFHYSNTDFDPATKFRSSCNVQGISKKKEPAEIIMYIPYLLKMVLVVFHPILISLTLLYLCDLVLFAYDTENKLKMQSSLSTDLPS